jgi:hypothetical protein
VKIFATPIDSHVHNDVWGPIAESLVKRRLEATRTTLAEYATVFDQAVALNAKSMILLMALAFALPLPLVFHRSGRPFVTHVVFSLHFYAFVLLAFCAALSFVAIDVLFGRPGLRSIGLDHVLSVIELLLCAAYLYVAIGTVYAARGWVRIFQSRRIDRCGRHNRPRLPVRATADHALRRLTYVDRNVAESNRRRSRSAAACDQREQANRNKQFVKGELS